MDAVLYAHTHDLPLFYTEQRPPPAFEIDSAGVPKINLFRQLLYELSIAGRHILSDKATSIRVVDNELKITTSNFSVFKATYERAVVFDDSGISGIPIPTTEAIDTYRVEDWFNVRCGMTHEHNLIETDSDFVRTIHFYPSERIDGEHNKKDLVSVSYMTRDQKESVDYSEVYVKFKTIDLMKSAGITGAKNGICARTGKQKYYALKVEHSHRTASRIEQPRRENTKYLKFNYENYSQDEELWNRAKAKLTLFT